MVFGGFPKKLGTKLFIFTLQKKYGFIVFYLVNYLVHFQGKKLIFWQKKFRPKKFTTLFISLKVTPSTQEPPKKI
jgi:hypothetical protein